MALFLDNELSGRIVASSGLERDGVPEFLIAEVWSSSRPKVLVAVVYRPPKNGFLNLFEDELVALLPRYKFAFVLGDFNSDLLSVSHDFTHLKDFLASQGLQIVPLQPTHHTQTSDTWLDVCAVSDLNVLASWGQSAQPSLA